MLMYYYASLSVSSPIFSFLSFLVEEAFLSVAFFISPPPPAIPGFHREEPYELSFH